MYVFSLAKREKAPKFAATILNPISFMRKHLLLLLFALSLSMSVFAWTKISLVTGIIDDMPIGNGHGKSPMRPPVVYIEDHALSFVANHPEYILNIKDEDGEIVYSTTVFSAMTQVTLPSTLSGDYEIELLMGNWKFTGFITLE